MEQFFILFLEKLRNFKTTSTQNIPRVVAFKIIICIIEVQDSCTLFLFFFSFHDFFKKISLIERGQFINQNYALKSIGHRARSTTKDHLTSLSGPLIEKKLRVYALNRLLT